MTGNDVIIEKDAIEPFLKNGYVLGCSKTRHAIYIDPGEEASRLLATVEERDLTLVAIVNTHAHLDHICGVERVRQSWDIPVYLHPQDMELYNALPAQAGWFGLNYPPAPPVDHHLDEGASLVLGDLSIDVYHTPGHSPGSVCLVIDRHVFCGDVIFAGSIGRTDLPGGSHETLIRSIREKVLPLGDDRILYPGHGPETTVGRERKTNPFLEGVGT